MKLEMTDAYLERLAEPRKIRLINKYINPCESILDFGCGNGLYAPALKNKCKKLIGLDLDLELIEKCKKLNLFSKLIHTPCPPIEIKNNEVDTFFANEVIEHLPELSPIMKEVERVTKNMILLTMPNPIFPHFKDDPTHILKYTISSLKKDLNKSPDFQYTIRGLGFENIPGGSILRRINQAFLWFFPSLSPTVAIIGKAKK